MKLTVAVAVLAALLSVALIAPPAAEAALTVTRAELSGGRLRVEGQGALANATITIDGTAMGKADGSGAFRIEKDPFSSGTCKITVSDGSTSAQKTLSGCTPTAPPPPPPGPPAPTPLAPANGGQVLVPFTISWSQVLDATAINGGYNWEISSSSSFSPLVQRDSTFPRVTQATVSGLVNGTYFWRVQAVNGALEQSAWSPTRSFNVTGAGPGQPGTPMLNQPQGGTQFHPQEKITWTWSAVPDAASYIAEWSTDSRFPVGTSAYFSLNNIPETTDGMAFGDSLQGVWFMRVRAVNADRVAGLPSNVITFSVLYSNPVGPPPAQLTPADGATLTLPVTLTWADGYNPQDLGYEVEISQDAAFANCEPLTAGCAFLRQSGTTGNMTSLAPGIWFWRVRSVQGDSSPTTAAVTAWSPARSFTVTSAPPAVTAVTLTRASPFSGEVEDGMVQLNRAAPSGGVVVNLTSSDPNAAPVPSTVTVPAGFAVAQFHFQTGQVTSASSVTLTATLGSSSASLALTVQPPSLKELHLPSTMTGGAPSGGIVMLNGLAPPGGAVVSLASNSPAVEPPATVTVAAGDPSVSFVMPTNAVTTATTVSITASWKGATVQSQLTLTPQVPPASLTLDPVSTVGTSGSSGTVTIASPASGDVQILLASSDPSIASVSPYVMVPAGSTTGGFLISTQPPAAPTTVTIFVSGAGVTKSATLTVHPFGSSPPPPPPPPATDTVSIQRAEFSSGRLRVEATSTNSSAVLKVYVTSTDVLIGTLTNDGGGRYRSEFSWPSNPQSITVKSSLGGSATKTVSS